MIRSAAIGGTSLQNSLAGFFTSSVTIMRATNTLNEYGEPVPSWAPLLEHIDLDAMVAGGDVSVRMKRQEFRTSAISAEMLYRRVLLNGSYPQIDHADRVQWDGRDWAIISIVNDVSNTFTEILIESIEPGNV